MTYRTTLTRRTARLRASLLAAATLAFWGCNSDNSLTDSTALSDPQVVQEGILSDPMGTGALTGDSLAPSPDGPSFGTASFSGGIPFGTTALPTSWFGTTYNGALRNIWPNYLNSSLGSIKSRGGKVVLMMAGNEKNYKNPDGTFSLTKWKSRVDAFRKVNFTSYVKDGTVIGHYLIDEPNDPANWSGKPISASTLEEMARYSKQFWPDMPTIVRVDPTYLGYNHRYLDAAWAQYVNRKGSASDYIRTNVAAAQSRGLALVTGMNVLKGGVNNSKMTPSQVQDWGSTLLANSYSCAFISWQYNSTYLSSSGVKSAMSYLRKKAQSRSLKSCKG